jgi:FkbM family methyltransferase
MIIEWIRGQLALVISIEIVSLSRLPTAMKIYLSTCNSHMHLVERWQYLFNKFWGDHLQEVVLIGYDHPKFQLDSNIRFVSLGQQTGGPEKWGVDLRRFFEQLEEEYFIYWLEDQILVDYAAPSLLEECMDYCLRDDKFGRFGLSAGISKRRNEVVEERSNYRLIKLHQKAEYRISVQPSVWSKQYFLKYLKYGCTPWEYEVCGSRSAKSDGYTIYSTSKRFVIEHVQSVTRGDMTRINLGKMYPETQKELIDKGLITETENIMGENEYYSQYGQDKYVRRRFFRSQNDGFFIEVGADDGVDKSNTLYFEKLGWSGICVEPSPTRFQKLAKNRSCVCLNKAIHPIRGSLEFMDIDGYGKGLSGIIENYDSRHLERIEKEISGNENTLSVNKIMVDCVPLAEVLGEMGVTHVNYISIDVEGSELDVLKSIDFNKVTFDVIVIEDNYSSKALREFLLEKGYLRHKRIKIDEIYVSKSIANKKESLLGKFFDSFKIR